MNTENHPRDFFAAAPPRVASMQRSGINESPTTLTPTLSRATVEGAEPLTLEQRVEALELAFGRVTLHATNTAMAAVGASHKAPGTLAGPATVSTPTDDELRKLWRSFGGEFHGPNIETGCMPESKLLPFLRGLLHG